MKKQTPIEDNRIWLDKNKNDEWEMSLLHISCEYKDNALMMLKDALAKSCDMPEKADFTNIEAYNSHQSPGQGVNEMGTPRMCKDPKTSVLNSNKQLWAAKNKCFVLLQTIEYNYQCL